MQIIDGNLLALEITQKIAKDVFDNFRDQRPGLAIILAGDRPDSALYVDIKQQRAKEVGIDTHLYKIKKQETNKDILDLIDYLNRDLEIDGILVQLPLPKKYNTDKIIRAISPEKDVDGFHPINREKIIQAKTISEEPKIIPPVYAAIFFILKKIGFNFSEKQAVLVVNSPIFAEGIVRMLERRGMRVVVVSADDEDLGSKIAEADLLISAIGRSRLIKAEMIKPNATVIDVGINRESDGNVVGDVDFEEAKEMAAAITPVPGGIGPLTVAKVLENTWRLAKSSRQIK